MKHCLWMVAVRGSDGPRVRGAASLPGGIWALGVVSLCMDASSELIHSLLPLFMTTALGAGIVAVGVVEGMAEATASLVKVFAGTASDRLRHRKPLVVLGYGLSALTKPLFPLAGSIAWVFAGRFLDRVGKGVRGAPRDALIADITPPALRGAAYGLRQALDSVGAFIGPLLALLLMAALDDDITAVLWVAVVPAALSVIVLAAAVREPARRAADVSQPKRLVAAELRELPRGCWIVVLVGAVFTLARFSEAFLVLRAQDVGLALGYVPAVMMTMNVVFAAAAYPSGAAADRISHRALLVAGLAALVAADLVLAAASAPLHVFAGAAFWGIHMALTQGLFSKLVADAAPPRLRGTAFGVFNLGVGVAVLLASTIAGLLWSAIGPSATFVAGAGFAALAAAGVAAAARTTRAPSSRRA